MIGKLQKKFIVVTAVSIFIALTIVLGSINFLTVHSTKSEIFNIIDVISENNGDLPFTPDKRPLKTKQNFQLTPESYYEIRYFSVVTDKDNNILDYSGDHIASVNESDTKTFIENTEEKDNLASNLAKVFNFENDTGFLKNDDQTFAYKITNNYNFEDSSDAKLIVFLDCTHRFEQATKVFNISMSIGVLSLVIFLAVEALLSKHAIQPMIRNYEKQNQFITNAGHELKTPLSVISANTEVLEMMNGKNEWTESTVKQVQRLSSLISDLIALARSEERNEALDESVDFSAIVSDTAKNFTTVAKSQNKTLTYKISDGITINGNTKMLTELTNILTDNACKYCDDNGKINLELKAEKRDVVFCVANDYTTDKKIDVNRFFERFYRSDESHNSEKQGYGIGLSMAESIVKSHKGKISVNYKDNIIKLKVVLKAAKK